MALHPFEVKLSRAWPPQVWQDVTVMLAVSGGADSVALLRGMVALKQAGPGRLVVAHFNHRLRGAESEVDEAFVLQLCGQLGVACEVGRAELPMAAEAAARQARYRFFQTAAQRWGARYVATAHTADDQAETILHRIVRGTGLAGLAGIPRVRTLSPVLSLVRPLLEFGRSELDCYLEDQQQPFREDRTNVELRFTRNRIRHELLPQLQQHYNSQIFDALCRLGTLAGQAQEVIDAAVAQRLEQCVRRSGEGVEIDCSALQAEPPYLVRELLIAVWKQCGWPQQAMGYAKWTELAELVQQEEVAGRSLKGKFKKNFPGGVCAERQHETLKLARS